MTEFVLKSQDRKTPFSDDLFPNKQCDEQRRYTFDEYPVQIRTHIKSWEILAAFHDLMLSLTTVSMYSNADQVPAMICRNTARFVWEYRGVGKLAVRIKIQPDVDIEIQTTGDGKVILFAEPVPSWEILSALVEARLSDDPPETLMGEYHPQGMQSKLCAGTGPETK